MVVVPLSIFEASGQQSDVVHLSLLGGVVEAPVRPLSPCCAWTANEVAMMAPMRRVALLRLRCRRCAVELMPGDGTKG